MKRDIDLQDLIKIVSEIQSKDREKKVIQKETEFDFSFESLKKEFEKKRTIDEKIVFLKKLERNYIRENFESETRYDDLFIIESKLIEKMNIESDDIYYNRQRRLKEIAITNNFTGFNSVYASSIEDYIKYRTQIRDGFIPYYEPQFIYIYIYELFFGIGVNDEYDGFEMLFYVVTNYLYEAVWIKEFAFKVLLEYIIEHNIEIEKTKSFKKFKEFFYDFVIYNHKELFLKEEKQKGYLISLCRIIDSYCYTYQKSISDVKKLTSYLLNELPKLLNNLDNKLKQISTNQITINDIIFAKEEKSVNIYSLYNKKIENKEIELFDNIKIKYEKPIAQFKPNTIIYQEYRLTQTKERILKYICSELEYIYNENNNLPTRTKRKLVEELDLVINNQHLSQIIISIINDTLKQNRTKNFEVDFSKLENIRQISNEVSEKLITEFDLEDDVKEKEEIKKEENNLLELNEWQKLKNNLSNIEIKLLILLLNNESFEKINKFAINNGLLLEVIIENINNQANNTIGDNLIDFIDTEVYIYDEYINEINKLIGGKNND